MDSPSKIKLTKEDLDNIVDYFERDREQTTKEFGNNDDADMYLQLLKSFKQQILENQEVVERLMERKQYHLLCEGNFDSGSEMAKYHHIVCKELNEIEKG